MTRATAREFRIEGRRVWVAGHRGLVGSALVRRLAREACELVTVGRDRVDLRRQAEVEDWMAETRPELVFVAAATVGGIQANATRPAEFLYDNLVIETNIIGAAHALAVPKLVFLGSSCIYPRLAEQPMREDSLLSGPLEPTNEWYAIAKIAGIKLCDAFRRQHGRDFVSAMPTNLYGPGDNFDLEGGHVLPALMRRLHEAKLAGRPAVTVWGSGKPTREFLHVDDLADALVFIARHYSAEGQINVGTGEEITIADLARLLSETVGYAGRLDFDTAKPDGTPRKLVDSTRLAALGWRPGIPLETGVAETYRWFLDRLTDEKDAPRGYKTSA